METLLLSAATFAAERHRDQRRKDIHRTPYINHPIQVAHELASAGVTDPELLCAALLHDTIEDTQTTAAELTEHFGQAICDLVLEVTDDKQLPKQKRKELQIIHAPQATDRAKLLKLADKICNIRDIDSDSPVGWELERKLQYFDWAERVVAGCRGVNLQLDRQFDLAITAAKARLGQT